jgi:hypothetical protein
MVGHARQTIQFKADMGHSTVEAIDPMAVSPRWVMADILLMPTLKFGDPI